MDLVASIRKTGSRGGVNFSWDEVASSSHRENYLGHSLKAPVGRWQKGKDLGWYAKAEPSAANSAETDDERRAREHRDEIRKIKEAEEDAMARALGLPSLQRTTTGANSVDVGPQKESGPASEKSPGVEREGSRGDGLRRHGDSERRDRARRRSRSRSGSRHRHREGRRWDTARPRDRSRDGRGRGREGRRSGRERSRSLERSEGWRGDRRRSRSREHRWRSRSREHRRRSRFREYRRRSRSRERRGRSTSPHPRRRG